jgi:hypothetical protein
MREQYKVLSEKYTLVLESSPGWVHIQPTDNWYKVIKKYKLPHFESFIYWLNNHSKEWAINQWEAEMDSVIEVLDGIEEDIQEATLERLMDKLKADYSEDDLESVYKLSNVIAERDTVLDTYNFEFLPWHEQEQKRLAALNKDNPGIEMDI